MSSERPDEDSGIDHLLEVGFTPPADEHLKQRVLAQTTGILRRRRQGKQLGYGAGLAFCYLAGLGTMQLQKGAPHQEERAARDAPGVATSAGQTASPAVPTEKERDVPAVVLERFGASADRSQQFDYYCRAGNTYLHAEGDAQSAMRCYSRALDAGSDKDLSISSADDWLLLSLKKSRMEERTHAKNGG